MKRAIVIMLLMGPALSFGADFTSARITKIQNNVEVLDMANPKAIPAQVNQTITGENGVRTGVKSRAELKFNDNTLTRIGANTLFSFKEGQREVLLNRGTMLFQVPKDAGGMKVTTAAVTAAITGTTGLVETNSKSFSKFIILEGSARVFLNNRVGESMLLKPGKMLILPPNAKNLPQPVDINIRKIFKTSGLIQGMPEEPPPPPDGDQPPPPSPDGTLPPPPDGTLADGQLPPPDNTLGLDTSFIDQAISDQDQQIADGTLALTPLQITGGGTNVEFVAQDTGDIVDTTQTSTDTNPQNPDNQQSNTTPLYSFPSTVDSLSNMDSYNLDVPTLTYDPDTTTYTGGYYEGSSLEPPPSEYLFGITSGFDGNSGIDDIIRDPGSYDIQISAYRFSAPTLNINMTTQPAITADNMTNGTAFIADYDMDIDNISAIGDNHLLFATVNGDITMSPFSFGASDKAMMFHARGISGAGDLYCNGPTFSGVEAIDFNGESSVLLASTTVTANGAPIDSQGNDVGVYSDKQITLVSAEITSGTNTRDGEIGIKVGQTGYTGTTTVISIITSTQLRAFATAVAEGHIHIHAESGRIEIAGGSGTQYFHAGDSSGTGNNGVIEITNDGTDGQIALSATTTQSMTAEILKIGALGADGIVNIGSTTLDALTTMKIYGGSSNGSVTFSSSTNLNGSATKIIAAPTVSILGSSTIVTVDNGDLTVYANSRNYGGAGNTNPNPSIYGNFSFTGGAAGTSLDFDESTKPGFNDP